MKNLTKNVISVLMVSAAIGAFGVNAARAECEGAACERPFDVVIDPGFSPAAVAQIQAAIDEWNVIGRGGLGHDFFTVIEAEVPIALRELRTECAKRKPEGERIYVIRSNSATEWSAAGFDSRNPGRTVRCESYGDPVSQTIYLNEQLIKQEPIKSVMTRQFGGTLGFN